MTDQLMTDRTAQGHPGVTGATVFTGGSLVTPDGIRAADLVLANGAIAEIREPSPGTAADESVVDVTGCYVLPGGVDPHTHPLSGTAPATLSASCGGTTTMLSFTLPNIGEGPVEAFVRARDVEVPLSPVDMGLHASYLRPGQVTRGELEQLRELGVSGIKVFLAYPELGIMFTDGPLFALMRDAAAVGLRIQVHCEVGEVIEVLVDEFRAAGRRELCCFAQSRPVEVEDEAVRRTLTLAEMTGASIYLVHLTTAGGMAAVRAARTRGVDVLAEACTHHLLLDEVRYSGPDAEKYLIAPPLRSAEHIEALWEAVHDGTLDTIGSDHSQVLYHHPGGDPDDFTGLPYGFPGAELRMPLVLTEGLRRGVSYERLVDLLCTGPARSFGHLSKGRLEVGADADVAVWDPSAGFVVDPAGLHDGWGETPYTGWQLAGAIRSTWVRGVEVSRGGTPTGVAPAGRFLPATR